MTSEERNNLKKLTRAAYEKGALEGFKQGYEKAVEDLEELIKSKSKDFMPSNEEQSTKKKRRYIE